ncbi:succinate dehydrogenase assembly factor 2 [Aestuariispira ectoiniformans]|uniref:succinate dehydrogenase assembly factor 2 n=1 Tax=Aestuariispira ectoiniformans TaxID=2775080 RepID=UPI00223BAEAF|nr:succinate dehydrogenase assembly factor 2 [Aestuariispira ectoiniformans]
MDNREKRLKRLAFRAVHRGIKELDILVGDFADQFLGDMTEDELNEFEGLLSVPDQEFYAMLRKERSIPEEVDGPVLQCMITFTEKRQGNA